MNMKKIAYLVMAALGLVGEVYACYIYATDVSEYDAMLHLGGYSYEKLPFTMHETFVTLLAIFAGLALIVGMVMFLGDAMKSKKA